MAVKLVQEAGGFPVPACSDMFKAHIQHFFFFYRRDSAPVPLKSGEREGRRTETSESQRTDWSHASTVALRSALETAVQFLDSDTLFL